MRSAIERGSLVRRVIGLRDASASRRTGGTMATLLLALVGATSTGCAPGPDPVADVKLSGTLAPLPPRVGPATVDIALEEKGQPLTGAKLRVKGNTSRGTSSSFATVHETGLGSYRAQIDLAVRGDWVISIDADLADGRSLERTFNVRDVQPR